MATIYEPGDIEPYTRAEAEKFIAEVESGKYDDVQGMSMFLTRRMLATVKAFQNKRSRAYCLHHPNDPMNYDELVGYACVAAGCGVAVAIYPVEESSPVRLAHQSLDDALREPFCYFKPHPINPPTTDDAKVHALVYVSDPETVSRLASDGPKIGVCVAIREDGLIGVR
jgi:hypothetical protein